jgi:hypothetical protein
MSQQINTRTRIHVLPANSSLFKYSETVIAGRYGGGELLKETSV